MSFPDFIALAPRTLVADHVQLPGSKSISNRVLLLAALADGVSTIKGLLNADDTAVMLTALRQLGLSCESIAESGGGEHYRIQGCGGRFPVQKADIFLGNAGTALRPLTAALAAQPEADYRVYGVKRMHERPIADLVEALNAVGAAVSYEQVAGYPPLLIHRPTLQASLIRVRSNVSSQFLTAVLIAAPLLAQQGPLTIEIEGELISAPYIHITCELMAYFGVKVERQGNSFWLAGGEGYRPRDIAVEGDASSASYFLAMGAITGLPIRVQGVGRASVQGDIAFAQCLERAGIPLEWGEHYIAVRAHQTIWQGQCWDCLAIPDAAMTLAVMALFADGVTRLEKIASWRVKETDRIAAMATELRKLGATVEAGGDYIEITPPSQLVAATIDTYDDHRMAMCFSLASLIGLCRAGVSVGINAPGCVAKTYPHYFEEFLRITAVPPQRR